jgi:hypothetical protein
LQESAGLVFVSLQISHHTSARNALQINGLRVVQGGLVNAAMASVPSALMAAVDKAARSDVSMAWI